MNIDQSTFDDFIIESRDHLNTLEENLMLLEEDMNNPDTELINRLFRAAHTIKGGAGFLGLTQITKLAHSMENLLSNIRDGINKVDIKHIDILLDALDTLRSMIDNPNQSNSTNISEIVNNIDLLSIVNENIENGNINKIYLVENGESIPYNQTEIKSIPKNYKNFFLIKINLAQIELELNLKPYNIISQISKLGYIISGELDTANLSFSNFEDELSLIQKIFLASPKTKEEIISSLPPNSIKDILAVDLVDNKAVDKQEKKSKEAESIKEIKEVSIAKEIKEVEKIEDKHISKDSSKNINSSNETTVKLKIDLIEKLMVLTSELVLTRNRILLLSDKYNNDTDLISTISQLDAITSSLQESVMQTRMQPVGTVFNKFPRIVRDLSKSLGKNINLIIKGAESELDKTLVESLSDPMTHLIRNACDHGVELPLIRKNKGKNETGNISLDAYHESGQINIVIEDDGAGIDIDKVVKKAIEKGLKTEEEIKSYTEKQKLHLIMLPGFSTADKISDVSGRGVGMDVVKTTVEKLGGNFDLETKKDRGSKITLRMPLTLAIVPSFVIESSNKRFAIPQISIEEIVTIDNEHSLENNIEWEMYRLRDELVPIIRLNEILENPTPFTELKRKEIIEKYQEGKEDRKEKIILILKTGKSKYGLIVDNVLGTEEIVVKPLHNILKKYSIFQGATIMGDGKVALILNADGIGTHADITFYSDSKESYIENITEQNLKSLFLFSINKHEQYALYLNDIIRIEKVKYSRIDSVGKQEYISIGNKTFGIIRLPNLIDTEKQIFNDEMYLILLKKSSKPVGVLATEIIDSINTNTNLDYEAFESEYILGTQIINDKMTLFLDSNKLKEIH